MKILLVAGTRPNFMKIAPIIREFGKRGIEFSLVHTGQHYDEKLSKIFFDELEIPAPDHHLKLESRTENSQIAEIMQKLEPIIAGEKPDFVLVVGDVSSTLAAALSANKTKTRLIHVEAGCRSFNREMPEETNRILTDRLSDILFAVDESGRKNLEKEGVRENVFVVGNTMIDEMRRSLAKAEKTGAHEKMGLQKGKYAVLTVHRQENVDKKENLKSILEAVREISEKTRVVWPVHHRAKAGIREFGLEREADAKGILKSEPLGYLEMLELMKNAEFVMTDSGGVQQETTALGVPCFTLRNETELPITCEIGTNTLVGNKKEGILKAIGDFRKKGPKKGRIPELWDGKASERIAEVLLKSGVEFRE